MRKQQEVAQEQVKELQADKDQATKMLESRVQELSAQIQEAQTQAEHQQEKLDGLTVSKQETEALLRQKDDELQVCLRVLFIVAIPLLSISAPGVCSLASLFTHMFCRARKLFLKVRQRRSRPSHQH